VKLIPQKLEGWGYRNPNFNRFSMIDTTV